MVTKTGVPENWGDSKRWEAKMRTDTVVNGSTISQPYRKLTPTAKGTNTKEVNILLTKRINWLTFADTAGKTAEPAAGTAGKSAHGHRGKRGGRHNARRERGHGDRNRNRRGDRRQDGADGRADAPTETGSEERSVGTEGVRSCKTRGWRRLQKKKTKNTANTKT